jgi:hypothetical protein
MTSESQGKILNYFLTILIAVQLGKKIFIFSICNEMAHQTSYTDV